MFIYHLELRKKGGSGLDVKEKVGNLQVAEKEQTWGHPETMGV